MSTAMHPPTGPRGQWGTNRGARGGGRGGYRGGRGNYGAPKIHPSLEQVAPKAILTRGTESGGPEVRELTPAPKPHGSKNSAEADGDGIRKRNDAVGGRYGNNNGNFRGGFSGGRKPRAPRKSEKEIKLERELKEAYPEGIPSWALQTGPAMPEVPSALLYTTENGKVPSDWDDGTAAQKFRSILKWLMATEEPEPVTNLKEYGGEPLPGDFAITEAEKMERLAIVKEDAASTKSATPGILIIDPSNVHASAVKPSEWADATAKPKPVEFEQETGNPSQQKPSEWAKATTSPKPVTNWDSPEPGTANVGEANAAVGRGRGRGNGRLYNHNTGRRDEPHWSKDNFGNSGWNSTARGRSRGRGGRARGGSGGGRGGRGGRGNGE